MAQRVLVKLDVLKRYEKKKLSKYDMIEVNVEIIYSRNGCYSVFRTYTMFFPMSFKKTTGTWIH